jgi:ribosomal protein S27AE
MYSSSSKPVGTHKRLSELQPAYFQHPLDKAATENLAKVKGLDLFTKKFMELGLEKDSLNKIYKFLTTISLTHPWTVIRNKEINEWIDEGDYDKVFSMEPSALHEVVAKTERLSSDKALCPDCGHELVWIEQYQRWYCYGCNKYP